MLAACVEVGVTVFTSLIHSLSRAAAVRSKPIEGVAGEIFQELVTHKAQQWHAAMLRASVEPNLVSYNALLDVCAKASDVRGAERWVPVMIGRWVTGDVQTFTALVETCARA